MSVERLKRVLQRAREYTKGAPEIERRMLKKCIMIECGTSPVTYYNNVEALLFLGWIEIKSPGIFRMTDKDITEDYQ